MINIKLSRTTHGWDWGTKQNFIVPQSWSGNVSQLLILHLELSGKMKLRGFAACFVTIIFGLIVLLLNYALTLPTPKT
jgi:hypothetical protein